MIPRRVWVNLSAFFLLFAVLVSWAVRNVISLDAIDRPYRISASFESSPGLRANVAVTYLGVQVGTIQRVTLEDGLVTVELDIERSRQIPQGVIAAVRRKSAVGEPYVSLEMPPDYRGGAVPIDPDDGYHIPVESTSVPLSYAALFESVDALVAAIPPAELETVVHELATGLEGRGESIRTIIEGTADVTGSLADRSAVFDQLATDLTRLTDALAGQRDALGAGFDNLAAITDELAARRETLETLLATAPRFGDRVAALIDGLYPNLACAFDATGEVLAAVATDQNVAYLLAVLAAAPGARQSFDSAIVRPGEDGADGYYLGGSFTMGTTPVPEYPTPVTLPEAPPLPTCQAGAGPNAGVAGDGTVAGDGDGTGAGDEPGLDLSDRPEGAAPAVPATTDRQGRDESFPLAAVLLAFGLALGAVLLGTLRPWQYLPVGARRDDGDPPTDAPTDAPTDDPTDEEPPAP